MSTEQNFFLTPQHQVKKGKSREKQKTSWKMISQPASDGHQLGPFKSRRGQFAPHLKDTGWNQHLCHLVRMKEEGKKKNKGYRKHIKATI